MKIEKRDVIKDEVIKNLLSAQKRIAKEGNAKANIQIAKYLFRISQNVHGQIDNIAFEISEQNECYPPNSSK